MVRQNGEMRFVFGPSQYRLDRVIYVCRGRFAKEHKRDQGLAANILVHETLHSLGLGENPPTPEEISHRIHERCGI